MVILWPPHVKSWLIGRDPDAGRDWRQEEKGTTEDKMAGWHHGLDGRGVEWTPGVGDGQGGLACCDSLGHKESDTTERLNWTELNIPLPELITFYLSTHIFCGIVPILAIMNKTAIDISVQVLYGHKLPIHSEYQELWLLDCIVRIYLAL